MLIIVLACTALYNWRRRWPYVVMVRGKAIGWVSSPQIYQQALRMATNEMQRQHKGREVVFAEVRNSEIICERARPPRHLELLDPEMLKGRLLKYLTVTYPAAVITVDGKPILAVANKDIASAVLQTVEAHFAEMAKPAGELIRKAQFKEVVEIKTATVEPKLYVDSEEEALKRILYGKERPRYHRVRPGEVASRIARKYGLSIKELQRLNTGRDLNRLQVGDRLLVKAGKPLITVITLHQKRVREKIPFKEERRLVPHLPGGTLMVQQSGREGEKEVVYEIKCENGVEVDRRAIAERVIKPPVNQIIAVGGGLRGGQPGEG